MGTWSPRGAAGLVLVVGLLLLKLAGVDHVVDALLGGISGAIFGLTVGARRSDK